MIRQIIRFIQSAMRRPWVWWEETRRSREVVLLAQKLQEETASVGWSVCPNTAKPFTAMLVNRHGEATDPATLFVARDDRGWNVILYDHRHSRLNINPEIIRLEHLPFRQAWILVPVLARVEQGINLREWEASVQRQKQRSGGEYDPFAVDEEDEPLYDASP